MNNLDEITKLRIEVCRLREENRRLAKEAGYVEMTWIVTKEEAERMRDRINFWNSIDDAVNEVKNKENKTEVN